MNRLIISFCRVTARGADGKPTAHVKESFDIVHPDDAPPPGRERDRRNHFNAFREIGAMFRGNADYFNIEYTKAEAVI